MVQTDSPQMTIRRMRISLWVLGYKHALSICNTFCFFPLQQWLHDCATIVTNTLPVLLYIKPLDVIAFDRDKWQFFRRVGAETESVQGIFFNLLKPTGNFTYHRV